MATLPHRKKIVFVLSGYGRYARGAERMVKDLVVGLSDTFDCQVLGSGTEDAPGAVPLSFISRDHPFTGAVNRIPVVGHLCRSMQLDPLNWEWIGCARAAAAWLKNHPCDVLVPEGGRWGGWLGSWWRSQTGTPFVDIAQGAVSRWEISAARWRPDCYVAPTRVTADEMARKVPGLNVRVISSGVDTKAFSPGEAGIKLPLSPPVIIAVGALEPLKRMDCIISAVKRWGKGSLLLVGDGPLRSELTAMGHQQLGPGRFHWCTATNKEMPGLYRSAEVLVSASRSEAFGLVYLEALASGLSVVTEDDPIRREVVGDAGLFCQTGDPVALAAAIEQAVNHRNVQVSRQRALGFDTGIMITRYKEMFSELLTRRSEPV